MDRREKSPFEWLAPTSEILNQCQLPKTPLRGSNVRYVRDFHRSDPAFGFDCFRPMPVVEIGQRERLLQTIAVIRVTSVRPVGPAHCRPMRRRFPDPQCRLILSSRKRLQILAQACSAQFRRSKPEGSDKLKYPFFQKFSLKSARLKIHADCAVTCRLQPLLGD